MILLFHTLINSFPHTPDPPQAFALPPILNAPSKLSLLLFTTQLTRAFHQPQPLVLKRLTLVAGAALGSSVSPTGLKEKTEFRKTNKSKLPLPHSEQQAERRSCPEVVVLKVTRRGAALQEVLKSAAQDVCRRQLPRRPGRREGGSKANGGHMDVF